MMVYNKNDMFIGKSLDLYGEWCSGEFLPLDYAGKIVVDVGANIGTHTLEFAKQAKYVFSFEPHPFHFAMLTTNIVLNVHDNVAAFNVALSDQKQDKTMVIFDPQQQNNFGSTELYDPGQEGVKVHTQRLDDMIKIPVDLIKIDAEGHEYEVLCGAEKLITQHKPILYVECDRKDQRDRVIALIESYGYSWQWHVPWLYNPDNFYGYQENVFPGIWSEMLLCTPLLKQ